MSGMLYFAIGDVHGEADKLRRLHAAILDRIAFEGGDAKIVHLGDYVDRGPDSRGVIEQIMALEEKFANDPKTGVFSLLGNHERMMLDSYDAHDEAGVWWTQGGKETADSYAGGVGLADIDWRATIPAEHVSWLRGLPSLWRDKERRIAFVHAGIDPARFPECPDSVRLWTRSDRFFDASEWPERAELKDLMIVHGHTPQDQPENFAHRINVDTGACYGGRLTAVMLKHGQRPQFLRAD